MPDTIADTALHPVAFQGVIDAISDNRIDFFRGQVVCLGDIVVVLRLAPAPLAPYALCPFRYPGILQKDDYGQPGFSMVTLYFSLDCLPYFKAHFRFPYLRPQFFS